MYTCKLLYITLRTKNRRLKQELWWMIRIINRWFSNTQRICIIRVTYQSKIKSSTTSLLISSDKIVHFSYLPLSTCIINSNMIKFFNIEKWECRVKVNRLDEIYIPFGIPLWGVAEPTHLHIDNHLNFLFHGQDGHVLGAVAYPRT